MLRKVKVDPITRDRLGRATLAEIRARLLAIDCQTCGRPFDASTPGLVVHRDGERITVTLHHQHCAEPRWFDHPAPPSDGPPTLTWRAATFLPEQPGPAVFLVNPSCESTVLRWTGTGWWPAELDAFVAAGMTDDVEHEPAEEVEELTATLEQGRVRVDLTVGDRTFAWSSKTAPRVAEAIDERGRLLVAVTQLRDPGAGGDLSLGAGRLACGLAAVRYAPEVQTPRAGDVSGDADAVVAAACAGDARPIGRLTGQDRHLAVLRVAALYGTAHVFVSDDVASTRLVALFRPECAKRGLGVSQLPDHRPAIVVGTPNRFAAARARDPRLAARLAVVLDVDPVPAELLAPYPRVLRVADTPVRLPDLDGADVEERLLRERIVFLGSDIDDEIANRLVAQLLLLAAEDPDADITFFINSSGGSVSAAMAVLDTMELIEPDVSTWVMGMAAGSAQLLATCGAPGKRFALPHARLFLRNPSGPPNPTELQRELLAKWTREITGYIAKAAGQPVERVREDAERERWFSATEALEYGLVDQVVERFSRRTR